MQTLFFSRIPQHRRAVVASMAMLVVVASAANAVGSDSPTTSRSSVGTGEPGAPTPVSVAIPLNVHTEVVKTPAAGADGRMSGNITSGFTASFFDGDIAEVILYDRILTDQERLQEGYYLQSKFNLGGFSTPAAPLPPDGVVASNPSSTSVTLSWNPSSGAAGIAGYQVYAGSTLLGSTTGTFIDLTNLASGATFDFTVVAVDALGRVSSASTSVGVTTTVAWPYASDPFGFANGDTIPNYEDAQAGNPAAGIMTVTITSPANGTTIP